MDPPQMPSARRFLSHAKASVRPGPRDSFRKDETSPGHAASTAQDRTAVMSKAAQKPAWTRFQSPVSKDIVTPNRKRPLFDLMGDGENGAPSEEGTTFSATQAPTATPSSSRFMPPRSSTPASIESRPSFRLSTIAGGCASSTTPLPVTFSPQKRGQAFVPGGLAATMQMHVFDLADRAIKLSSGDDLGVDATDITCRLDSINASGNSVGFARGTPLGESPDVNVVLVCTRDTELPQVGDTVRLRAPLWQVTAMGQQWTMGVDWKTT